MSETVSKNHSAARDNVKRLLDELAAAETMPEVESVGRQLRQAVNALRESRLLATITRLQRERDNYSDAADVEAEHADELQAELATLRQERDQLREALRPFVENQDWDAPATPSTRAQLAAARALLSPTAAPQNTSLDTPPPLNLTQMRINAELGLAGARHGEPTLYLGDPAEDLALLDYNAQLQQEHDQLRTAASEFVRLSEAVPDFGVEFENRPANLAAEKAYEALRALLSPAAKVSP